MGANTINYNEEVLKGGLLISGVSILITMLTYIINDGRLDSGFWLSLLTIIINIGVVVYVGISFRNAIGGFMTYKETLKFLTLTLLVAYLVGTIFNMLLYNVIDPDLPQKMKEYSIETTEAISLWFGAPPEAIDAGIAEIQEQDFEEQFSPMGLIKSAPLGVLGIFIFSLIVSIFVKKEEPFSDRVN